MAPRLARVTAPNAGPFTFTGTNSFLIGTDRLALVDPGPDDDTHLEALRLAINGRRVEVILLTHTHRDHSAAAARLRTELGAQLWFGGQHRLSRPRRRLEINPIHTACDWDLLPDRVLKHGERFDAGGVAMDVIATPGHCANHLAFGLFGTPVLLTGDHIMGWNSTLISVPDGSMVDYFASLDRVRDSAYTVYAPAHGGLVADGPGYATALKAHRQQRNSQILEAVVGGARSVNAITARIYPGVSMAIRAAARMTVTAHLEYLQAMGAVRLHRRPWGLRVQI